jgi:hypothetical protein
MYSHLKSNNSSSVILPAIISIIITDVVICTGYKFKENVSYPKIQNRIKQLFISHRSLRAWK